jgi:hypothetical protein
LVWLVWSCFLFFSCTIFLYIGALVCQLCLTKLTKIVWKTCFFLFSFVTKDLSINAIWEQEKNRKINSESMGKLFIHTNFFYIGGLYCLVFFFLVALGFVSRESLCNEWRSIIMYTISCVYVVSFLGKPYSIFAFEMCNSNYGELNQTDHERHRN